ncbi:hypothetical protein HPB47_020997 [Ixodes persulcatus]|uniref:Uncharacterized protein n=1 Tax=Ixodes persulcatus TaxID=34615 RepID=A0AC60QDU9_IXOPE|nr:hypothetical protein HPB47_020997 [Ixodes persulcatus]
MSYVGLTSDGNSATSADLADHGLVFMFCPFGDSYVQPIGVFASKNATKGTLVAQLLLQAIVMLEDAGAMWSDYATVYKQDQLVPAGLRVCPKITNSHIYPSNTELMRVKLATQVFSRSMASGMEYYKERKVPDLWDCDATREFTLILNDLFDSLNRRCKKEGVTCQSSDFRMITFGQKWLDEWELEFVNGDIVKDMFLTKSTSEGLRPPMFGNCAVVEGEKTVLDISNFRSIFRSGTRNDDIDFVTEVKRRLDSFILQDDWECEDVVSELNSSLPDVSDCIVYYLTGFLTRKMTKLTTCESCLAAFTVTKCASVEAALTNCKNRGGLSHPNIHLHRLLKAAEEFFAKNADSQDVYWGTIDHVLDTCTLSFPCGEHKGDVISKILHFYVSMRMRQHCKHVTSSLKKDAQKKKKEARLCAS